MLVACSVLTIDRIIDAIRSAPGDFSGTEALGLLRTSDLVLAGLAGGLLGCLAWLEWRRRGLTDCCGDKRPHPSP